MFRRWLSITMACVAQLAIAGGATADGVVGVAKPWEINFQPAYSPVMEQVHAFNHLIHIIIIAVVVLVLSILAYVIFRFNARRNPVPSKTAHNTLLEVVWTVLPVLALLVIVIPSMKLLYFGNKAENPDMTLKVTGHQWYWTYNYPDHGDFSFDSIPIQESELKAGQPRLLAVDNPVVVPVGATVQVLVASDDVVHSWAVPSLGMKKDATPGRVNETWFRADQEGTFYGMCSELCGVNHYFMPIEVRAVSKEAFDAWVDEAKQKFASNSQSQVELASTRPPAADARRSQ
jgi:cytochrome c oxidase subunit 2